jgi:uncharacterized OsmC-like protein
MKNQPNLAETIARENVERRALRKPKIATHRVDIRLVEQLRFEASFGPFTVAIDEPPERGGTGIGPPPLVYFLAGAASCLMTQYMKLAIEKGIRIDFMIAIARGHFDRRVGGAFTDIAYDIEIQSSSEADVIRELSDKAERMCYAHNTLKKSVLMKTNVTLNGKRLT